MGDFSAFAVSLYMSVPRVDEFIQILKPLKTLFRAFCNVCLSQFEFQMFFTLGISKQLWLSIPIWSVFIFSCFHILTICLLDVLHTAFPQATVPAPFVKDFYFNKIFNTLGKYEKHGMPLCIFSKNTTVILTSSIWYR